jgi:hypothetical protein
MDVMNRLTILLTLAIEVGVFSLASAQQPGEIARSNPFVEFDQAADLTARTGLHGIRLAIDALLKRPTHGAGSYLLIAELMKRAGDMRAESYYQKAIDANRAEPAYDLFYSDYLRNVIGPGKPIFDRAEKHYLQAQIKLKRLRNLQHWDHETASRVERGLIALHQEDGIPVVSLHPKDRTTRPVLFFSSSNRFAHLPGDFDNVDDTRGFSSEAMLASSRLNTELTQDVLREIVRVKDQFETVNRFRFRYKRLPVANFSYRYRGIDHSQITNFFEPNKFNRMQLDEFGITVEKTLALNAVDLSLQGSYKRVRREGGIEFLPNDKEDVNQFEARAAVSRFVGPDKAIFEAVDVYQDVNQRVATPLRRDRRITAAKFTYQLLRFSLDSVYRNRFGTRGLHMFAGALNDEERFGVAQVVKNDYFAGASLKGLSNYEITVQPTVFTSRVAGVSNRLQNSQYRTDVIFLWRIKDEEKQPGLPERVRWLNPAFIHLTVPFKHDIAIQGLDNFENYRLGIGLDMKFFRIGSHRSTFLASARYSYQRYYKLDRNINLLSFGFSMGF